MKKSFFFSLGISVVLLAGLSSCATSEKVQVVQPGDSRLSCSQIKAELKKLDEAQKAVGSKKGVTGTNVAAAVFFWPALAYTEYDASKATDSINAREARLAAEFNRRGCR